MGTVYYVFDEPNQEYVTLGKHNAEAPWVDIPLTLDGVKKAFPYCELAVLEAWWLQPHRSRELRFCDGNGDSAPPDADPDGDWRDWTETDAW